MNHYCAGIALTLTLFATACTTVTYDHDEVWATIEGCGGNELCAFATLSAAEFNKLVGKPAGRGISVRGAKTDGKVVSLDMNVPDDIKNEPVRSGLTIEQQLTETLRKDLCSTKETRRFFDIGGQLQVTTYLPSGKRFSRSAVKSC